MMISIGPMFNSEVLSYLINRQLFCLFSRSLGRPWAGFSAHLVGTSMSHLAQETGPPSVYRCAEPPEPANECGWFGAGVSARALSFL